MLSLGFFGGLLMAVALLPLSVSTLAYALVETRHRGAWARTPRAARLGHGPYRTVEVVPLRLRRAPLLVRAAALTGIYWAWLTMGGWLLAGLALRTAPLLEPVAAAGVLVAALTWSAGCRLLRRDPGAVRFGRWVAAAIVAQVAVTSLVALVAGGEDALGLALTLGSLSLAQSALLVLAVRRHGHPVSYTHLTLPTNREV